MNKSVFRVVLCLVLLLSLSLTSAFAGSYTINYPEPATSPTQGYLSVVSSGAVYTYSWNTTLYGVSSGEYDMNDGVVVDIVLNPRSITFTFRSLGSATYYDYNLTCFSTSIVYLTRAGQSAGNISITENFGANITEFYFAGNVGKVTNNTGSNTTCNVSFNNSTYLNNQVGSIYNKLGQLDSTIALTYDKLTELYELIESWDSPLNESTNPLPNQGLTDFDSSSSNLRNESDVSSSLDNVFDSVDFGSFSNGFSAIWGLVDRVFAVNPIFTILVALVLTLGLLSLIFNRR